jgi:hypothetical protein
LNLVITHSQYKINRMKNLGVFKKLIYLTSLAGIGLFLNGCAAGYVATEPSYVEYSRPQRPSDQHIWVDGDWAFNRQTHSYVQQNGYWVAPNERHVYVSGQWQTTPRGKYWSKGHWQKKAREENRRNRY